MRPVVGRRAWCLTRSTPLDPYHRTKADKHWVFAMFDPYHYPYHSVPNRTSKASGSTVQAMHQRVQDPILQRIAAERSQIIERRITVAGSPRRQSLETVSARFSLRVHPDTAPECGRPGRSKRRRPNAVWQFQRPERFHIAAPGAGALRQLGNTPSKCALSLPCHHLLFDFCGPIP
jgi:hypothetical protein